jgi:hypothetical protein
MSDESDGSPDDTTVDERYPHTVENPEGMDKVVRLLDGMDEDHSTKAVGLVLAARTEWVYAVRDGEIPGDIPFDQFVQTTVEQAQKKAQQDSDGTRTDA